MSATSPRPAARNRGRSGLTETLAFKTVALVAVATVAVLLWQLALPRVVALVGRDDAATTVSAVVSDCTGMDHCNVRFTDPGGATRVLPLSDPGMFRVGVHDRLTVRVDPSGHVSLAGWQAWLDAAILLVLAVALTGFAIGWWRRVLEHSDTPYDGGEPPTQHDEAAQHRRRT